MTVRIIRAARLSPQPDPPQPRRPAGAVRVVRAAKLQALREAEQLLREAREQARDLVERARDDAAELRSQAREAGHAEAAALLLAARQRAASICAEARSDLTGLAISIAEKLLGEALAMHPERVSAVVTECLRHACGARRLTIKVNPRDRSTIEEMLPRLRVLAEAEVLRLEPSPSVSPGGCIIETELGQLDGRLEVQLQAIRAALETER